MPRVFAVTLLRWRERCCLPRPRQLAYPQTARAKASCGRATFPGRATHRRRLFDNIMTPPPTPLEDRSMRVRFSIAPGMIVGGLFVLSVAVLPAERAVAQQPPSSSPSSPANPDYGLAISNEQARAVAAAAIAEAKENGCPLV